MMQRAETLLPSILPSMRRARAAAGRVAGVLRRLWETDLRKRYISWTRFREKRLTWRGFLSFDTGARIRVYIYIAIAACQMVPWSSPGSLRHLVRIACQAIEDASLPRLATSRCTFEKARQVTALRRSITRCYDLDRNRRITGSEAALLSSETGLSVKDLTRRCSDADLTKLVAAAQARRLLPDAVTRVVPRAYNLPPRLLARDLRRANWREGMTEYEREHKALWREVDLYTNYKWARPRDYLELETWRRGASRFCWTGTYLMSVSWLFLVTNGGTFHTEETYTMRQPGNEAIKHAILIPLPRGRDEF